MKKKIAVIGLKGLPAAGGGARVGENIYARLKDEFDITVYSISTHTDIEGKYRGLNQIVLKGWKHPAMNMIFYYLKAALHCLYKNKYDVVHVHHLAGAFILPLLYWKYPTVMTAHGNPELTDKWKSFSGLYYRLMRYLFYNFTSVRTTVSEVHKYQYEKQGNCDVYYIPNGVDDFDEKTSLLTIDQSKYLIFAAARIIEIKGLHLLLQACKNLNYQKKVLIVGDLDQIDRYRLRIKELARGLNIEFTGLIKNKNLLYSYIKNADYFLFPSLVEAMSSMLLEVAMLEVPVICSDIPENRSIFNNNEMLFFKANDVDDLQKKIIWANEHKEEMKKKAKRAKNKVEENFTWDSISKQYQSIFCSLLN